MIQTEQQQVDTLRSKCNQAKYRIWIASPYIGKLKDVQKIIGGKWMLPSVDCRILTDTKEGFIRNDTFNQFINNNVEIRHLLSIHAKIYIIDDWCLVTSANLTGTAFYSRFEMGISSDDASDVAATFLKWWDRSTIVTSLKIKFNKNLFDYQDGNRFPRKFKSQPYRSSKHDKYEAACEKYISFANHYSELTGRIPQMKADGFSLLQEVDYMFNFLFHDHPDKPSNNQKKVRSLTQAQQDKAILNAYNDTSIQYSENPQKWRLERTATIKRILSPKAIKKLDWNGVKDVADCLHCLNSIAINKVKFTNPKNNDLKEIKHCWSLLLHSSDITSEKISEVTNSLSNFGLACVQELIGWYYPESRPMMNGNSDCGMRYFGIDI